MRKNYLRLRTGLAIFLPNSSTKVWWIRLRKDGKEFKKSLKTKEVREAEDLALDIYKNLIQKEKTTQIIKLTNNTFIDNKDIIIDYFNNKFTKNTIKGVIRSFNLFMEKYENMDIDNIKSSDIKELIETNKLEKSRFKDFKMMIFALFDSLEEKNLIERRPIFPMVKAVKSVSYDNFSDFELNEVMKELYRFRFDYERSLKNFEIYLYFALLECFGCRPGDELLKIKLVDFFKQDNDICLNILNGKNKDRGGNRSIVLTEKAINHICLFYCAKLDISNTEESLKVFLSKISKSQELLFEKVNHKILTTELKNIVNKLKEKNIIDNKKRIAPYSFRHTYITNALKQRTDIYLLAKLCGTSVKEIENKYSHMTTLDRKEDILKIQTNILDLRN